MLLQEYEVNIEYITQRSVKVVVHDMVVQMLSEPQTKLTHF